MKLYIFLGLIFLLSFVGTLVLPMNELFKGVFATPALLALIGALFQLLRDNAAHESKLDLQRKQQIFNLGATSHMANVTFDKHVEFCEKYMMEVDSTMATLYREGTTEIASDHAKTLSHLRREYAAWLTVEIGNQLAPFEEAMRKIGANEGYIRKTSGDKNREKIRIEKIDYVNEIFCKVLDINNIEETHDNGDVSSFISEETIKKRIRKILDIEDLVRLRKGLIDEACSYIKKI